MGKRTKLTDVLVMINSKLAAQSAACTVWHFMVQFPSPSFMKLRKNKDVRIGINVQAEKYIYTKGLQLTNYVYIPQKKEVSNRSSVGGL